MQYANELEQLREMGIIVENRGEDLSKLAWLFRDIKYEKLSDFLSVTILTTMACNFKCTYCFEEPSRQNVKMDRATCDDAMAWIKKQVTEASYKELYITFYGGEPLLNEEAMERIALKMASWCATQGIKFKFMLQTNGYLMTPEIIRKYLPWGLADVRVSLDGVGEEHDRNRPLRGGGGTFDRIMKNIAESAEQVKIGVSVSYDRRGVDHVERLLDYLENFKILHKLGRIICSPIHASLESAGHADIIRDPACLMNYSDTDLIQATLKVNRIMEKKGVAVQTGLPVTVCPVCRRHGSMTIDPEGRIYLCNSMLGHPEFSVGDVRKGYNSQRATFLNLDVGLKCPHSCPYLPICNGGCRMMSYLHNGRFDVPYCQKKYLDQVAPELIKKEYDTLVQHSET
jgi:uncharacterized protein